MRNTFVDNIHTMPHPTTPATSPLNARAQHLRSRNQAICRDYARLRAATHKPFGKPVPRWSVQAIFERLAAKYHLSVRTIQGIVYGAKGG